MAAAPIVLVPGFWLGAWAWDEVAAALRADGHEVTALTLPGLESADGRPLGRSRSSTMSTQSALRWRPRGSSRGSRRAQRVRVLRLCRKRPHPEQIAAMVYVDTAPGKGALDSDFEGAELPMNWESIEAEENLDGLSEEQGASASGRCPFPVRSCAKAWSSRTTARRDIRARSSAPASRPRQYKESREGGLFLPRRPTRAAGDLDPTATGRGRSRGPRITATRSRRHPAGA